MLIVGGGGFDINCSAFVDSVSSTGIAHLLEPIKSQRFPVELAWAVQYAKEYASIESFAFYLAHFPLFFIFGSGNGELLGFWSIKTFDFNYSDCDCDLYF